MDQAKTVVVTGGNDGLGRTMALAFAEGGWDVAFNYTVGEEKAQTLVAAIEGLGRRSLAYRSDVGIKSEVDAFYKRSRAGAARPMFW